MYLDIVNELLTRIQDHLIVEKPDDFGWIPLHYAAYIGHKDLVDLLLTNRNVSLALSTNKQGMSALHISAEEGHVDVIKLLIEKCPEICELLDEKDQTSLHVAVENKRKNVVKFFLESLAFQDLVNEKDKNGNTALHLAAYMINEGDNEILVMLAHDSNIDKVAVNKAGMTFVDIVVSNKQLKGFEYYEVMSKLEREICLQSLEYYVTETREANQSGTYGETKKDEIQVEEKGGKVVDNHPTTEDTRKDEIQVEEKGGKLVDNHPTTEDIRKEKQQYYQQVKQARKDFSNINLVIITIIASVSFTAMFTMTVGYKDNDVLRGRSDFKLFMLFDSLSFVFASTSMVIHFIVPALGKLVASRSYAMFWILVLTWFSLVTMILAFEQGIGVFFHDKSDQVIANATRYGVSSIFITLISLFIGTAVVFPVMREI